MDGEHPAFLTLLELIALSVWSDWIPINIIKGVLSEGWSRKGQLSPAGCGLSNGQRFLLNECFTLYPAHHSLMAQQVLRPTALPWMLRKQDLFASIWGRIQTTAQENNNFTTTPQGGVFPAADFNNEMFHLTLPCPMASTFSVSVQNPWMFLSHVLSLHKHKLISF